MTSLEMSFKARLRNMADTTGLSAQQLLQNFLMERFLARLEKSDSRHLFVFKGGFLLSRLLGIERRVTMDMDATLHRASLSEKTLASRLKTICSVDLSDGCSFSLGSLASIRATDAYGGIRAKVLASYGAVAATLSIDVTTGDAITPHPLAYTLASPFAKDDPIQLLGYPIETILAEKLESILVLDELGTRPRDYYDLHMILQNIPFDPSTFRDAFSATCAHRGNRVEKERMIDALDRFGKSPLLLAQWGRYTSEYTYASSLLFSDVVASAKRLATIIV